MIVAFTLLGVLVGFLGSDLVQSALRARRDRLELARKHERQRKFAAWMAMAPQDDYDNCCDWYTEGSYQYRSKKQALKHMGIPKPEGL